MSWEVEDKHYNCQQCGGSGNCAMDANPSNGKCADCAGTGYKPYPNQCSRCIGTGTCHVCGGSGKCTFCGGTGKAS